MSDPENSNNNNNSLSIKDGGDNINYKAPDLAIGTKIYFEDVLEKIKKTSEADYNILNDIFYFLTPDFDFDQISNLSIYKDDLINTTIKKYKYLFNIIIEPIFNF